MINDFDMINAKQEFLVHIDTRTVKCAAISGIINAILKQNYTSEEYSTFLSSLDSNYDNGYGKQELDGIIWYTDGTWTDRGEYDGSEWWEHHMCPEIPESLI